MANELVTAVVTGDLPRINELLAANPGLSASVDDRGVSALLVAVYYGHREIAQVLASRVPTMSIHEAAALGDRSTLAALARFPETLASYSADGWTPLHLAAAFGGADAVEFLLEKGADVSMRSQNPMNNTALHATAAVSHDVRIARLLLDRGANVNATQAGGFTALHSAAFSGDLAMARLLLDRGADLDLKTDDGQTALELAREKHHDDIVKMLEAARLDVRSL